MIGRQITLEDAKRLDQGSYIYVQGVIEKIEESVSRSSGFSSDYIVLYVNQTHAVLPQP